ncbi:serine/arginine repetitive matrix protein 1-like isoform X2 [Sciurus carolinensis]|uniref:serine/arginine repetitive matrix protein 1-like isoform X2 n=1 Tax=Sciurus carolinensis TaxID=30640 RepID=UPI001FB2F5E0|nr:serine/arginine repetitive matrix protein 1-like isoform X2 [Sciurus carolinensis]
MSREQSLCAAPAPTGVEKRHTSWPQLLSRVYSGRRPRRGIRNYSRATAGRWGRRLLAAFPGRRRRWARGRAALPSSSSRCSSSCRSVQRRWPSGSWGTSLRLLRAPRPALPGGLQRRRRRRRPRTLAPVCLSRRVQAFKFPALSAPSPWKPLTLSALPPPPPSPQTTTPPPTSPPPRSRSGTGSGGSRLHSPRRRRRRRLRQRPGLCPAGPRCPGKPTVRLPAGAHRRRRRRRRRQRRWRRRRRWRLAEAVSFDGRGELNDTAR